MKIIIVGLGKVGYAIAQQMVGEEHDLILVTHSLLLGHQTGLVATGKETLELLLLFGKNLVILAAAGNNQQRSKQNMETDFRHTIAQI